MENFYRNQHPSIYLPGDPRETKYVEKCWRLADAAAGLMVHERPDRMFISSSDFGRVIAELRAQYETPNTSEVPGYLIFGKNPEFRVLNAGTDDEAEVNRLNRETPGAVDFRARVRRFTPNA
jgi:hypothetical protein